MALPNEFPSPWKKVADRKRERTLKREAVIAAGAAAFNEKGFHNTSVDDIAARLNVSKPTIYYYIKNKEELLYECFRIGLESLGGAVEKSRNTGRPASERLEELITRYIDFMTTDLGRCMVRVPDLELSPRVRKDIRRLKRVVHKALKLFVEECLKDNGIKEADPTLIAFAVAGAINGIANWYDPAKKPSKPRKFKTSAEIGAVFSNLFLHGLDPKARSAGKSR